MFQETYRVNKVPVGQVFGVPYPLAFTHPYAEYHALTNTAALLDLSHWGVIRLTGGDRVRLFNALTTNDVASLEPGRGCHSAITTVKGKLLAEVYALVREEDLLVLVSQGSRDAVVDTVQSHIIADDVECVDVSADFCALSLQGPRARSVVWRVFPDDPLPLEPLTFNELTYQGMPACVLNHSITGEKGYHLIVRAGDAARFRDYLIQAGRAEDAIPCGSAAWNVRRVEGGLPWFGVDVDEGNFPKECRLDAVVSYTKGCFLGQETLARMHHRGHPNWLLVGMTPLDPAFPAPDYFAQDPDGLASDPVGPEELARLAGTMSLDGAVPAGTRVLAPEGEEPAGKPVGRITSPVFSPRLGGPLLMGYVRTSLAEPGTTLVLDVPGNKLEVAVTELPLVETSE